LTGNIVSQAAWFGSLIVLGALLPPRSFGTVAIGVVIAAAAAVVQDAGGRGSIVLAKKLYRADLVRVFTINVAVATLVTVAIAVLAGPIIHNLAPGGDVTVLRVFAVSIGVRALAIVPMALLQRTMRFKLRSGVMAASTMIAGVTSVAAGVLGAGVWALVIRQLGAAALLPIFAWVVAFDPLRSELAGGPRPRDQKRPRGALWFFVMAATDFLALNLDTVIVGHLRGAAQLGLYSLAFTLAFAPLTNFAGQVGTVIFPAAAAAPDLETVAQRMLGSIRLTALILVPLLPPALVLAPVVLPGVFGPEWKAMVVPFQILVVTGVGYALMTIIGNSLAGVGQIAWRARIEVVWCFGMAVVMVGLVRLDGLRGAALAHLVLFVPFALIYVFAGTRRVASTAGAIVAALKGVLALVACQSVASAACLVALESIGVADPVAATVAAVAGLLLVAALFIRFEPELIHESRAFLRAVFSRSSS
jgi:O-antigen/teichoic acid export membrane protein